MKWFNLIGAQRYSRNAGNKTSNVIPGNLHPRGECCIHNKHQKQILNCGCVMSPVYYILV